MFASAKGGAGLSPIQWKPSYIRFLRITAGVGQVMQFTAQEIWGQLLLMHHRFKLTAACLRPLSWWCCRKLTWKIQGMAFAFKTVRHLEEMEGEQPQSPPEIEGTAKCNKFCSSQPGDLIQEATDCLSIAACLRGKILQMPTFPTHIMLSIAERRLFCNFSATISSFVMFKTSLAACLDGLTERDREIEIER